MATKNSLAPPRSLGRLLNFATGACNRMCQEMLEEHDLTLPQWVILSALWRQDDMPVKDIAAYTSNALPAASRIIDRMVDKGLLKRRIDKNDRRAVRITLSEKGQGLRHLHDFYQRVNARLLDGFSVEEEAALFGLLGRVDANARAQSKT